MTDRVRIAVIIPALNEALTIGAVVEEAVNQDCDVFVVDDNSSDATRDAARCAGATVLRLPYTSGAWPAVQAGLLYAFKSSVDYDFFVTLDADGQHEPAHIHQLVEAYGDRDSNVLIGSCPQRGSVARRMAWRMFSSLTRLNVNDMTSGFRLYDRKAACELLSHEAALLDYQDVGVLLLLRRYGIRYSEVPVLMRDRINGHSRIFDSWVKVGCYMGKTLVWIIADWVSGAERHEGGLNAYDIF